VIGLDCGAEHAHSVLLPSAIRENGPFVVRQ